MPVISLDTEEPRQENKCAEKHLDPVGKQVELRGRGGKAAVSCAEVSGRQLPGLPKVLTNLLVLFWLVIPALISSTDPLLVQLAHHFHHFQNPIPQLPLFLRNLVEWEACPPQCY